MTTHTRRKQRRQSTLDDHGVSYGTWHPDPGVPSDCGRPQELPEAAGLKRVAEEAAVS